MQNIDALMNIKGVKLEGDSALGLTEHSISIVSSDTNLGNLHDSFASKMESGDTVQKYVSIGGDEGPSGRASLSDHLFSGYQAARADHQEALTKVAEIFDKEKVEFRDVMDARQILEAQKYKGALAIKAVEKSMETFNQLLRMQ